MRMRTLMLASVSLAMPGCVHAPRLVPLGRQPYMFWPPPSGAAVAESTAVAAPTTMGESAAAVAWSLREAGYTDVRWYPIGGHYEHGFAVTTRLEGLDGPPTMRWSARYPDPVELRWLESADPPELPPGRYRALLVAFTDLPPTPGAGPAPIWDFTTVMETGNPPPPLPPTRGLAPTFRQQTFVYEYTRDP